jgi:hypothetical protein
MIKKADLFLYRRQKSEKSSRSRINAAIMPRNNIANRCRSPFDTFNSPGALELL